MKLRTPVVVVAALAMFAAGCSSSSTTSSSSAASTAPTVTEPSSTEPSSTEPSSTGPSSTDDATSTSAATAVAGTSDFKIEIWADNWFQISVGDQVIGEDAVAFNTERSFNSGTFTFSATYPFDVHVIARDYFENDSGLEYVGTDRQQMGDGGVIWQITDLTTNTVVSTSSSECHCLVTHRAPLNPECVADSDPLTTCQSEITPEPAGWTAAGFDTSSWPTVTEYSEAEVGVKEGYLDISWDPAARLIWGPDLKIDNTLLCTHTVTG